ncbi:MAG TPA: FumA C-terminus/TtdB family hydratase beta subunit [Spirochaetales bacterium]|nr:FumA C-terminus/TtdB family hydratase beta subunit [Spirochaetales bacterium]
MIQSFHEACYEAIQRRFIESPVLYERLPLPIPEEKNNMLHVSKEALEYVIEAGFTSITYNLPQIFYNDIVAIAGAKGNSLLERYLLDLIISNACIAHEGVYPLCQDTGTASIYSWRGTGISVPNEKSDYTLCAHAVSRVWQRSKLRNSQLLPMECYGEKNSQTNLPLLFENFSVPGLSWDMIFAAKGGGSSNKSTLVQTTKSNLNREGLTIIFAEYIKKLGVSACPPYTIGIAIGGQSPEESMFAAKLASSEMLDYIGEAPDVPFRDHELEALFMQLATDSGWGAQFGGHYLARKVVAIRLPRHAASLPISFAVSCSAHRWAHMHIDKTGIYLERMADPTQSIPPLNTNDALQHCVKLNINDRNACQSIRAGSLVRASGSVILARDAVHARLLHLLKNNNPLPSWAYEYPVFYASPTETPEGYIIGSIGPTTSRRMDSYLPEFLPRGIFMTMIGKGERSHEAALACKNYGGVYFAAPGGCAALLAKHHVLQAQLIDWPELGMEAVRLLTIKDMPLVCAIDAAGTDFYSNIADIKNQLQP